MRGCMASVGTAVQLEVMWATSLSVPISGDALPSIGGHYHAIGLTYVCALFSIYYAGG